jgi:[acyl-carrier-protein] S-malonyltransferase
MLPGVAVLAMKHPDQIGDARALAAEHGPGRHDAAETHHPGADIHPPEWTLLVAPLAGTFRAGSADGHTAPGTFVTAGTELGLIEARGDRRPVSPDYSGAIIEWLVEDGDPVSSGQPIARLQPETSERKPV